MRVSMTGESQIVGGQKKTVITLFRSFLPLPLPEYGFIAVIAVVPALLVKQFGGYEILDQAVLAVMVTVFFSLRLYLAQKRYKDTPTLEVSDRDVVLPYSHFAGGVHRVVPKDGVESIVFFKGVGRLRKIDTYMILTDEGGRKFKISGFVINMVRLRDAMEKHDWTYTRRRNPNLIPHLLMVGGLVGGLLYLIFVSL